jgi:hypothetical protein
MDPWAASTNRGFAIVEGGRAHAAFKHFADFKFSKGILPNFEALFG